MGVYATTTQVRAALQDYAAWQLPGLPADTTAGNAKLERLIARAEADLDAHLIGGLFDDPEQARMIDPGQLGAGQRAALVAATASQVAFRLRQREHTLIGDDDRVSRAGDFSFVDRPVPRISPEATAALAGRGLIRRSGTVPAESEDAA